MIPSASKVTATVYGPYRHHLVNVTVTNSNVYTNKIEKKKKILGNFCDAFGFTETWHKFCFISTWKFQFPWPVLSHSQYSLDLGL